MARVLQLAVEGHHVVDEPLSMVALVLGLRLEKRRQLAQPLHVKVGRDREVLEISAEFHPDLLVNGLVNR